MQDTTVTKSEPLITTDDFSSEAKITQDTTVIEKEFLITFDDLVAHKQKLLLWKLLIIVIVVNLLVLVSIILCAE